MVHQKGLLFGGRGFLGRPISRVLGIPSTDANICEQSEVRAVLEHYKPLYCINAAGVTGKKNIGDCQSTTEALLRTMYVNGIGPALLGSECKRIGASLIHLSSGSVFETTPAVTGGYTEEMVPAVVVDSISAYALSKRMGEISVSCYDSLVVRFHMPTSTLLHGRNLLTRMAGYPTVDDVSNTIVTVADLIVALEKLIEMQVTGVVHVANPEPISNPRIMELYREFTDPSHYFEIRQPGPKSRPPCVLSTAKLRGLGIILRPTEEAVIDCVKRYCKPR